MKRMGGCGDGVTLGERRSSPVALAADLIGCIVAERGDNARAEGDGGSGQEFRFTYDPEIMRNEGFRDSGFKDGSFDQA